MKRRWWIAAAIVVAALLVIVAWNTRRRPQPAAVAEVTYRPSDPANLAATGRPQLVEFFHHA